MLYFKSAVCDAAEAINLLQKAPFNNAYSSIWEVICARMYVEISLCRTEQFWPDAFPDITYDLW